MTVQYNGLNPLTGSERQPNGMLLSYGNSRLKINLLTPELVRVRYAPNGNFAPRRSWATAKDDSEYSPIDFNLTENNDNLTLTTAKLQVKVRKTDGGIEFFTADGQPLSQDVAGQPLFGDDGSTRLVKIMPPDEYYYGFGERSGLLEKRGKRYTCWNTDPVERNFDHGPGADTLHQAHPFFMSLRLETGCYGLYLNNTYKTVFDVGHRVPGKLAIETPGGELDYYFMYGQTPAGVVEMYTGLVGRAPLPPRWALGYHQSRWSYFPEGQVREIADGFRSRNIPADVIHVDIDYMDGYRVFTWDKQRFPEPAALVADLKAQGFKTVLIIDPGVKDEPGGNYVVYNEGIERGYFVQKADGTPFKGYVWPDLSVFPDFARADVRQWWGDLHAELLKMGVHGIWNDMNEPAISKNPFGSPELKMVDIDLDGVHGTGDETTNHAEIHNIYAYLEDWATYEALRRLNPNERMFTLTRAGSAGIQKYSAVWTGDNNGLWEHLEMTLPQMANLGLSGVSFTGADIGGFHGPSSPELWARWIELGVFYPFARGHAALGTPPKEPWQWGETVENIARHYIEARYRLLPYLYTLFEENSRTGAPVWRPLLYHYPADAAVLTLNDEVMVGDALLVAPIYRPGVERRYVYLPAGNWYNYWTGTPVDGQHRLETVALDEILVYARGGSIIPHAPVMQYSDERPLDRLTLHVYLDGNGAASGRLYEDDGTTYAYENGASCTTSYTATTGADGKARLKAERTGNFSPASRSVEVKVYNPRGETKTATRDSDNGEWELTIDD
jgi:alpha-glucosidase